MCGGGTTGSWHNCTTPLANYFHLLRRQLHRSYRQALMLDDAEIAAAPQLAVSKAEESHTGSFVPPRLVGDDAQQGNSDTALAAE